MGSVLQLWSAPSCQAGAVPLGPLRPISASVSESTASPPSLAKRGQYQRGPDDGIPSSQIVVSEDTADNTGRTVDELRALREDITGGALVDLLDTALADRRRAAETTAGQGITL